MKYFFIGGQDSLNTGSTTYAIFNNVPGRNAATTSESQNRHVAPMAFTVSNFKIVLDSAPGAGKSYTFRIRKNGANTDVVVTISDSDTTGSDTVNSVSISQGDDVGISITPSGTPTSSRVRWRMDITTSEDAFPVFARADSPPNNSHFLILGSGFGTSVYNSVRSVVPISGTMSNLFFSVSVIPGAGKTRSLTAYKNNSAEALTVTLSDSTAEGSDTSNSVSITAGDDATFFYSSTGSPSGTFIYVSYKFAPSVSGRAFFLMNTSNAPSTSATNYDYPYGQLNSWNATESNRELYFPAMTVKKMYVLLATAPGASKSYTFTLRKGSSNTSSEVAISGTDTSGNTTADVSIADGDLVTIQSVPAGTPASLTNGIKTAWEISFAGGGSSSVSPSVSPSASVSPSSSTSPSSSISPSVSPSASISPSSSASASVSPSASISPSSSVSPSPSAGYENYTRGNYAALPTDNSNLETNYSSQDYTDVNTKNDVRVDQVGVGEYMIHQFKDFVGSVGSCSLEWEGQTTLAPSSSTVNLQIYNHDTDEWETVDSDNTSSVSTDFSLTANIADLTDYKDAQNVITCRVYQLA